MSEGARIAFRRLAVVGALCVAACDGGSVFEARDREPRPDRSEDLVVELDVGLTSEERQVLRFLPEGSDLVPLDLLRALVDVNTGQVFSESLDRYGFLPAPASDANPYGLPIGWTTNVPRLSPNRLPYVGVNCAACHTGQLDYRGRAMRIDGAPNLADIEALGLAVRDSVLAMLAEPRSTLEFADRLAHLRHPEAGIAAPLLLSKDVKQFLRNIVAAAEDSGRAADRAADREADELANEMGTALRRAILGEGAGLPEETFSLTGSPILAAKRRQVSTTLEVFSRYGPIVRNRLAFALRALRAIEVSPMAGPGRDDPWGLVRNVLFGVETALDAPTSIPHLFHIGDFDWYHADGNTTSVVERDVTQAVALGSFVEEATGESSLLLDHVHRLEGLWKKVRAPRWPTEILGEIDREAALRGREVFERPVSGEDGVGWACADCHHSRRTTLFDLQTVGTDPNRALSFARPLGARPFFEQIGPRVVGIIETTLEAAGLEKAAAGASGPAGRWRATGRYVARRLDGVWATAPYLHNGSVPSLHHLLLPVEERPSTFPLGHREYDPERVGYSLEVAEPRFVFDTFIEGNSNAGHEFGIGLSRLEKADLLEYLKTL